MNINKMLKGAVAALTSAAALGALTAPAFAASGTYDLNGKGVDALSVHGGAQRIATIGNAKAKPAPSGTASLSRQRRKASRPSPSKLCRPFNRHATSIRT